MHNATYTKDKKIRIKTEREKNHRSDEEEQKLI